MAITIEDIELSIKSLQQQRQEYTRQAIKCEGAIEVLQRQAQTLRLDEAKKTEETPG